MTFISEKTVTARKDHNCDACESVLAEGINRFGYSRPELRVLAKARANNWKIKKGEKYLRQTIIDDGGMICTLKMIPEVDKICIDNVLYEE